MRLFYIVPILLSHYFMGSFAMTSVKFYVSHSRLGEKFLARGILYIFQCSCLSGIMHSVVHQDYKFHLARKITNQESYLCCLEICFASNNICCTGNNCYYLLPKTLKQEYKNYMSRRFVISGTMEKNVISSNSTSN